MLHSSSDIPIHIRDIRRYFNMSQSDLSKYFNIPIGTIRNWEQDISTPPIYVIDMIFTILWKEVFIEKEDKNEN